VINLTRMCRAIEDRIPANFNVSLAERIYPAADLSEQISLARQRGLPDG
jgi:glucan phosphorylase